MAGAGGRVTGRGPWWMAMLALTVLLAVGVAWLMRERGRQAAFPQIEGQLQVVGLSAPLDVLRDGRGVPHVFASTEPDAWLGLGLVHAQDRLAQMERSRRAARGELAAWQGPEALAGDRLARTLGFARLAQRDLRALPRSTRRALDSYAAGVNAHLAELASGQTAPPRALGYVPEPWRPEDSLAIWKHYAWTLGGTLEESLVLTSLLRHLGGRGARIFFPEGAGIGVLPREGSGTVAARPPGRRPADGSRVSPARTARDAEQGRLGSHRLAASLRLRGRFPAPLREAAGLAGRSVGSSAFAIRVGGRALLAGDVHMAPTAPAVLHQAHVSGGKLDAAGAALPGVPGFWSGFNGRLAWSATYLPVLVTDLLEESSNPRIVHRREEQIDVKGAPGEVLEVRETRRGPLVHGLLEGDVSPLVVHWTGGLPGSGPTGLLALARARSTREARAALARHHQPILEVVLVDRAGQGGTQLAGYVPAREVPSGGVMVPGRDRAYVWTTPIPAQALPRSTLSVDRPLVVAADGPPPGRRPLALETLWRSGRRAARIRALVGEGASAPRELAAILSDTLSPGAEDLIGRALALAGDVDEMPYETRQAVELLEAWDHRSTPTSVGAVAYHVFVSKLVQRLLEPDLGEELLQRYLRLRGVAPEVVVLRVLEAAAAGQEAAAAGQEAAAAGQEGRWRWTQPDFVREAIARSLRDVWITSTVRMGANRDKWTWGRLHRLRFRPLSPEAWSGSVADALGPWPYGGDGASVQAGEYGRAGFDTAVIAAFRLVADGGDLTQSLTALAPGPSEHPGHPDAVSGIAGWREGRLRLLSRSRPVVEDGPVARLRLVPAP